MVDKILITFILFSGFSGTLSTSTNPFGDGYLYFIIGVVVFGVIIVAVVVAVICYCCCCRKPGGYAGQVFQPAAFQTATIQYHSPLPYGQVGYNGTVNMPDTILTSNMTQGTTQQWQQSADPPNYEQVVEKQ